MGGEHYKKGKIEPIHLIESQDLGFHEGNVVKYMCRHKHSGTGLKDLKKAIDYIERLIKKDYGGK